MLEIVSSETFLPASTQSGVGIGEANSDAMFREQADESNAFSTTIWSGSPILKLVGNGWVDEPPKTRECRGGSACSREVAGRIRTARDGQPTTSFR
jgi:hypothetical protein